MFWSRECIWYDMSVCLLDICVCSCNTVACFTTANQFFVTCCLLTSKCSSLFFLQMWYILTHALVFVCFTAIAFITLLQCISLLGTGSALLACCFGNDTDCSTNFSCLTCMFEHLAYCTHASVITLEGPRLHMYKPTSFATGQFLSATNDCVRYCSKARVAFFAGHTFTH